jgi:hypothetical protein
MTHSIRAKDIEEELLPEDALDEHIPAHPHLMGEGPVE